MVYTFPHLGEYLQMPWNECKPMDERLRFIARLLEGEKMTPLCCVESILKKGALSDASGGLDCLTSLSSLLTPMTTL
jgi:hypothetical protein